MKLTQAIKSSLSNYYKTLSDYSGFIGNVIRVSVKHPPHFPVVRDQLYEVGVMSLNVVAITGFATGGVLAVQAVFHLADRGLSSLTGLLVIKSLLIETGPVLTAFMLTGRIGAAMCAELGSMKVSEQIDALKTLSVDPLRYLVAPRFISGIVMLPVLTIFSSCTGIIGGYFVATYFYGISSSDFFEPLPANVHIFDIFTALIKAAIFGVIIVTICCYRGITTTGGAAGVGKSITQSVVSCYVIILIVNFFLSLGLNKFSDVIDQIFEKL